MIYKIVKWGDPVLERQGETVHEFGTPELRQFVDDMFDSMTANKGLGLAAPQVGVSRKITVIDVSGGQNGDGIPPSEKIVLINPTIIFKEAGRLAGKGV